MRKWCLTWVPSFSLVHGARSFFFSAWAAFPRVREPVTLNKLLRFSSHFWCLSALAPRYDKV